ncbi:helix-turn-helix transcriptional regulator [Caballeronia sp. GAWG2-1]|uniref:helix-turn-helix transcriptional regulator n=1 Tax=Caballeronia sp. GAWG2-1 TaxID=2921744 RepID=UPI00202874A3
MDYPVKTLSQLRPILKGFRKAAGLTQASMAAQLGVTQQTYAQLEANPAAASMERMFKVLRVLGVEMMLTDGVIADKVPPITKKIAAKATSARAKTAKKRENW